MLNFIIFLSSSQWSSLFDFYDNLKPPDFLVMFFLKQIFLQLKQCTNKVIQYWDFMSVNEYAFE